METKMNIERKDWIRALTAHPSQTLHALAEQLAEDVAVTPTSLPQAGLGLLTLTDGAFHEQYYLGEFPLSACGLTLTLPDGRSAEGAAQVMADDVQLARTLAILDAILAAQFPGWERVSQCVNAGAQQRTEEDRRRSVMLTATRVDFAMLGNAEEDDDEN